MIKRARSVRYKAQTRVKGSKRIPMGTSVISPLERAVRAEMSRFKVSRSFVIATCVAYALNVNEQEDYKTGWFSNVKSFRKRKAS